MAKAASMQCRVQGVLGRGLMGCTHTKCTHSFQRKATCQPCGEVMSSLMEPLLLQGAPAYTMTATLRFFRNGLTFVALNALPPPAQSIKQQTQLHQQAVTALGLQALLLHLLDACDCHLPRGVSKKEAMSPASFWTKLMQGIPAGLWARNSRLQEVVAALLQSPTSG